MDDLAQRRFQQFQFARQRHRNLGLLAVHGTQFHRDLEAVLGALAAAITRHGFHALKHAEFPRAGE